MTKETNVGGEDQNNNSDGSLHLRIFSWNDVYELENFPHLKTLIEEENAKEQPDKTLVIMAGDFLAPSLLSALDKGRGMVDMMEMCGFTHVCFGNHETDIPDEQLAQRIFASNFEWVNTNMREIDSKIDVDTIPHDIVEVSNGHMTKRIGLMGFLTEDPSLYRPNSFGGATIQPIHESMHQYMTKVMEPLNLDLILPLTHQLIGLDRKLMNSFPPNTFPLILGGHDHEPFDEIHNGTRIMKTGHDGINTAIIDFRWSPVVDESKMSARMVQTNTYPPNPRCTARVKGHERILEELEKAKLFKFADWHCTKQDGAFSTENNRLGPTNGSEIITSILRMGMRAQCGIMNAGGIRGNTTYDVEEQEWFTWSDLKNELQFSTEMNIVHLPGQVLSDTIAHSRRLARQDPPVASGGYLHHCDQIVFNNETNVIESIRGKPFDPEQLYWCSMPGQFFLGIDNHEPLLEWAKTIDHDELFQHGAKPAKVVVVEMFTALLWLEMGSFSEIDQDGDGVLSRDEVRARASQVFGDEVVDLVLESIMSVADVTGTGTITPVDLAVVRFVARDMVNHVPTQEEMTAMSEVVADVLGLRPTHENVQKVVNDLREILDSSGDGKITRAEAMQALGELKRRSLLN